MNFSPDFSSSLRRILALTKKEFFAVLLDKKSRAQLFIAPLVMLFVFSFAITLEVKNSSLAVLNRDAGDLGRQLVSYFSSGPTFTRVFELSGTQEIRPTIENQDALMVLHIPKDFSRKLMTGQAVGIQTVLDGRKTNAVQIANGYAGSIVQQFARSLAEHSASASDLTSAAPQIEIDTRQLFNPNLEYIWFTMPVLLVLLTQMISLIVSGLSIARERELGTFEQLLVSPLSSVEIVIGKAMPAVCIAFGEGIVIHLIALTVFGVPFVGNPALMALAFLTFILSVTGMGLFISSLCNTQQQAFLGSFMYMVPAVLLSGFAAPIENMPHFLQPLTLLNPARHIISIALGLYLKGASFTDILPGLCWLAGIAASTLLFATWYFKKKTQ